MQIRALLWALSRYRKETGLTKRESISDIGLGWTYQPPNLISTARTRDSTFKHSIAGRDPSPAGPNGTELDGVILSVDL